jgi:hypothetical protein
MRFELEVHRDMSKIDWEEVAAFLSHGFSRPFRPDGLLWEFSKDAVLVLARSPQGTLIGSQGFLAMDLVEGVRPMRSAKSERTLVHESARGSAVYSEMYSAAMRLAYEDLGADCLWGLTATPDPFMKMGYWCHSDVYTHTVIPVVQGARQLLASRALPVVPNLSQSVRPAAQVHDMQASHPDYRMISAEAPGGARVLLSVIGRKARLRFVDLQPETDVRQTMRVAAQAAADAGCRSLRLSYNRRAPFGSALDRWLLRFPSYPRRQGGGHFIVRPNHDRDLRLLGRSRAWDLHGWEDVIHDPH